MKPTDLALNPLLFFALALLGFAWLWATRLIFGDRQRHATQAQAPFQVAGSLLIAFGMVVGVALTLHAFSLFFLPVAIVILLATWRRFRVTERRAFQLVLASAVRHQLPLPQVMRAFADGRYDSVGRRARQFAQRIEDGASVSQAVWQLGLAGELESQLGLLAGERLGLLDEGLAWAAESGDELRDDTRGVIDKLWYLVGISFVLTCILTFIMLKIVPVFQKMFQEFRLELPASTTALMTVSEFFVCYWFLFMPLFLPVLAVLLAGMLFYVGWLPINVPLIGWLARSHDAARVMRWLGLGVRGGKDVREIIVVLAETYPRFSVARRLRRAAGLITAGTPWHDALRSTSVLKSVDVAVLKAAERTGDLAWTLDELAASRLRRLSLRLRGVWSILFPALLLGYAIVVGSVAIGLFTPLIRMIQSLSGP